MICDIQLNASTGLWSFSNLTDVDFSSVAGTINNCSGAVTQWGTIISCEERIETYDNNNDGYFDIGWVVEVDPASKTVIDKRWALGNFKHENVAINANQRTVYEGVDDVVGYLYKFVATNPTDLSEGDLYVYKGPKNGTTGEWIPINNSTPAECNSTLAQSEAVGATVFNGVEDVEIGPDGWVYFAVKNDEQVYRFIDPDLLTGTGAITMETFVGGVGRSYDIVHAGGTSSVAWQDGCDNLAFDGDGNLWVFQDGGDNYIWVVGSDHTQADPNVKIFGRAPIGAEPTGITFTPDYKYLFMSIQHPNGSNNANQTDLAGTEVDFNDDVALVISLAAGALPIELSYFTATAAERVVDLAWKTASETDNAYFYLERSEDGVAFSVIERLEGAGNSPTPRYYQYADERVEKGRMYYYRLRQVDFDGSYSYSSIVSVRLGSAVRLQDLRLSPNPLPAGLLTVRFAADYVGEARVQIVNNQGQLVYDRAAAVAKGANSFDLDLSTIPAGAYFLWLQDEQGSALLLRKFVKGS